MDEDFINKLIPADDLHWDSDSQRHVVLSQDQVDSLIKACFRFGLKDREIKSIIEEYNLIKSGELLYRHFIKGNIGVYELDKNGKPIFESPRPGHFQTMSFASCSDPAMFQEIRKNYSEIKDFVTLDKWHIADQIYLGCSVHHDNLEASRIFKTIVKFCSEKGVDLSKGQNFEDNPSEESEKTWKILKVQSSDSCTHLIVQIAGKWFEFNDE
jgi:hypothetical protein